MPMENKYFLYGSGRDSATRALRRTHFPRETSPRIGPYTVRAGRTFGPLSAQQLASYERPLIEKVTHGTVQVYLGERPLSLGDLKSLFADVRGTPEVVNYEDMDLAALHAHTRRRPQDDHGWFWLVKKLIEAGQLDSARAVMQHMDELGLELDAERVQHLAQCFVAAKPKEPVPEEEVVADATAEEPASVPEALEEEPEAEEEMEAPAAEEESARSLPDGWRELSNKKLAELIKQVGAEMPMRTDKGALIGALETWLKG
jgi:hypothetical protein